MKITIKTNPVEIRKPLLFEDLRDGDLFQFKNLSDNQWDKRIFVMIDNEIQNSNQAFNLDERRGVWFSSSSDAMTVFRIFDALEVSEVREFKS